MKWRSLAPAFVLLLPYSAVHAQSLDAPGAVKAAIEAKYHVTQATADYSDIVTAGDVITLLKSGLVMYDATKSASRTGVVSYHDGKLNAGGLTKMMLAGSGPNAAVQVRQFVSGEKCWLVAVTIKNDGAYLTFLSDPINDVRYMGSIKFPVDKKQSMPGPDVMLSQVAEVISVASAPQQDAQPAPQAPAPAAPQQPPAAALAPIAPPPPPPDQPPPPPPTISLGQTHDQVLASFGQPLRVVKLGSKEIDFYKDMKVTYVNNKVTDVQ
jgi:hypothetical protein